jgi:molecular chaperone GrpE (heat shock protein)
MKNTINANQMNALDLAKIAKERSSLEQELQAARAELRNYRTITESEINTLKA